MSLRDGLPGCWTSNSNIYFKDEERRKTVFLERCKNIFFYSDSIAGKPEREFLLIDLKCFRETSRELMKGVVAE